MYYEVVLILYTAHVPLMAYLVVDEIILFLLCFVVLKGDHLHTCLNEAVSPQCVDPLPQHLTVKLQQVTQVLLTHAWRYKS